MRPYVRELEEYFAGKRREFSFPLDLRGTNFQLACWRRCWRFPTARRAATRRWRAPWASRRRFAPWAYGEQS